MNRGKSSFGVEMEGFVAWVLEGAENIINPGTHPWPATAGPLVIPRDIMGKQETDLAVQMCLEDMITDYLPRQRETTVVPPHIEEIRTNDSRLAHLRYYREWSVHGDVSLEFGLSDFKNTFPSPDPKRRDRGWASFELCSPALWATDAGFDEVRRVCALLTARLWVAPHASAGLHVHWGAGADWIPFGQLRRIAALTYGADRLLAQLHPAHRRNNQYARSNSLYTRLACGIATVAQCEEVLELPPEDPALPSSSHDDEVDNLPEPREEAGGLGSLGRALRDLSFETDASEIAAATAVPEWGPRGLLGSYTFDKIYYAMLKGRHERRRRERGLALSPSSSEPPTAVAINAAYPPPISVRDGVDQLLACTTAPAVAQLLGLSEMDRPAYNFRSYAPRVYLAQRTAKRTVEFRQAASSFDPDAVATWATVCSRLCEWAGHADEAAFRKVLSACTKASEEEVVVALDTTTTTRKSSYDVFDLLTELGLAPEARVLQGIAYTREGLALPDSSGA